MVSTKAKKASTRRTSNKKRAAEQPERLNFRLSKEIKDRVVKAATITGQALTDFAVSAISERADEILSRHNKIMLDKEEYDFFLQVLSEDREPSERSRAAAERYRKGQRRGVKYQF
jgi:uncharacterized protein (DUF1778 family)